MNRWLVLLVALVAVTSVSATAYYALNSTSTSAEPTKNLTLESATDTTCSTHCATNGCNCKEAGCSAPDYSACGGSCSCSKSAGCC